MSNLRIELSPGETTHIEEHVEIFDYGSAGDLFRQAVREQMQRDIADEYEDRD